MELICKDNEFVILKINRIHAADLLHYAIERDEENADYFDKAGEYEFAKASRKAAEEMRKIRLKIL
jgi:hypothetical protein